MKKQTKSSGGFALVVLMGLLFGIWWYFGGAKYAFELLFSVVVLTFGYSWLSTLGQLFVSPAFTHKH